MGIERGCLVRYFLGRSFKEFNITFKNGLVEGRIEK
jgi:hypothetical protein